MSRVLLATLLTACSAGSTGKDAKGTDASPQPTTPWEAPPCADDTSVVIVPEFEMVFEDIAGWPTMHYIPENPRGLVFVFHGRGGDTSKLYSLHFERMYAIFVQAGFGIVGTESQDRTSTLWDTESDAGANVDMAHHRTLRQELIELGKITEDTPLWAWGFSNGASFAPNFADMALQLDWPIRGVTSHNSGGRTVSLPTFITSSENDDLTANAYQSWQSQVDAGFPSEWVETLEYPFTRDLMTMHPEYDETKASLVFDELVSAGLIDDNGVRTADVTRVDALMNQYMANATLPGAAQVTTVVRVAWATHRPTSETACEERDFMIEHF